MRRGRRRHPRPVRDARANTTRGEAIFAQRLAERYGWCSVIVVSWGYHLVRARYVFGHCFDGGTVMRAVPRQYRFNLADWR
mgnify:CR=1 FL=1